MDFKLISIAIAGIALVALGVILCAAMVFGENTWRYIRMQRPGDDESKRMPGFRLIPGLITGAIMVALGAWFVYKAFLPNQP